MWGGSVFDFLSYFQREYTADEENIYLFNIFWGRNQERLLALYDSIHGETL